MSQRIMQSAMKTLLSNNAQARPIIPVQNVSLPLKLLMCALAVLMIFGVWAVGIISTTGFNLGCISILMLSGGFFFIPRWPLLGNLVLALTLLLMGVTISDLILRITAAKLLYYRPHEMFIHRWPARPYLDRYTANVDYHGDTYGDLAALSGIKTLREPRKVIFRTDAFGLIIICFSAAPAE